MKIEIDTNKDTYSEWLQIQRIVEAVYQIRRENRKKAVAIKADPALVDRCTTPFG